MDPNIVILAGGISSRMKKHIAASPSVDPSLLRDAREKSKAMIGVGPDARPFLDYLLYNIEEAGYKDVVIVVGERDDSIRDHYERGEGAKLFRSLKISYAVQKIRSGRDKPVGTADALLEAFMIKPEWRGDKLTVCNSDNLYSVRALKLLLSDPHDNALIDYDRSALKFGEERIAQFAVTRKDNDGFLESIIEKPSADEIAGAKDAAGRIGISMNFYRLSYDQIHPFLRTVPFHPIRQEKELPVAVKMMVERYPHSMFTIPLSEHVPDLTMQSDILEVKAYLEKEFK
jgi:glucose-1-phosphate adenylyltransferase